MKVIAVVGARPNFMKIAPLMEAFRGESSIEPVLVHTGQHYDHQMSDLFFRQLGIPEPDINLGVRGGSHAVQTGRIMEAFEPVVVQHNPDAVVVVGDVNSTIACGMVAAKLAIKLVHVEAGLRSFDRTMPEEINRVLTDSISDLLFCTEQSGVDNLIREGASEENIFLVGNVMIDTLLKNLRKAKLSKILDELNLRERKYALLTLHRPTNVDDPTVFSRLLDALEAIQRDLPIVFPIHPRTLKNLDKLGLAQRVEAMKDLRMIDPAGYLDFLKLMSEAKLVLTDSGGIQEETTILKVPCLTLRDSTERPITVDVGSNRVVGTNPARILAGYREVADGQWGTSEIPPLWDGRAGQRITKVLLEQL